ncbi:hypothetical protein GWK47_002685 [Chionoecetes opilio]|uniref:Uncharacterized protein n=1 Tax=Chionoecetes opilio TaxID=41210 RepID=A0A8J4XLU0_CHIOP|nr:hypothetical protein GWK47_002685 [Chionoecetes opilio]
MLREVCQDVSTEPTLLPLDGELLRYRTANTAPEARVDICSRGFWTRGQRTFLDIRIFDPMAASHRELSLEAVHHRNELEKIRAYGDRILQVDHGTFTPLVFTTSGGMAPKARSFYSRLADLMSVKKPAKDFRRRLDEVSPLLLPAPVCPPVSQGYEILHSL